MKQFQIFKGHKVIVCPICGDESSANKNDYWSAKGEYPIVCVTHRIPMVLAEKCEVYKTIKKEVTTDDLPALT